MRMFTSAALIAATLAACGSPSATATGTKSPAATRATPPEASAWRAEDEWFTRFVTPTPPHAPANFNTLIRPARANDDNEPADDNDDDETRRDDDMDPCPNPCPTSGCAVQGTGKAMSNMFKRHVVAVEARDALPMPFGALRKLQVATDALMPQGAYPPAADRVKLRDIPVGNKNISEGDVVRVAGYLAGVRREGKESVNCKLTGAANNDIHLSIVERVDGDEFEGFVAEVIPQGRPRALEAPPLAKLSRDGTMVLIVGPLFYDAKHVVNVGPVTKSGEPKRFTLWEIHPISQIYVCPSGDCEARLSKGWVRLGR